MIKIFNKTIWKRIAIAVASLVLAALVAAAVYGYIQFQSLQQKVGTIDTDLSNLLGTSNGDESNTTNEGDSESRTLDISLVKKEVRTVRFSDSYDQATGETTYEPRELLEVTLKAVNNSDALLYEASSRFFAATNEGKLVTDASYGVHEDDKRGESTLTLAPKGTGTIVLYFELDGRTFSSVFYEDTYGYSGTYSVDL
jgi:hypothetical protein